MSDYKITIMKRAMSKILSHKSMTNLASSIWPLKNKL
jgi:hypothetical protein